MAVWLQVKFRERGHGLHGI